MVIKKEVLLIVAAAVMIFTVLTIFYIPRSKSPEAIRKTGVVEGTEVNISSMITRRGQRRAGPLRGTLQKKSPPRQTAISHQPPMAY
jgi:hypothetical protein